MATVNVIFRSNKCNKKGLAPVVIELYDPASGKRRQQATSIRVEPKFWDNNKRRVRTSHPNSVRFNGLIAKKRNEMESVLMDVVKGEVDIEKDRIKDMYQDNADKDFFDAMQEKANWLHGNSRFGTAKITFNAIKTLRKFFSYLKENVNSSDRKTALKWKNKKTITFRDFDLIFLERYEDFMRNTLKLASCTICSKVGRLSWVYHDFIKKELVKVDKNPFPNFRIIKEEKSRNFLDDETLTRLDNLSYFGKGENKTIIKDMYLFVAYGCGLRWSDVSTLRWLDVHGNVLRIKTIKTQTHLNFPLPEKAKQILDKYRKKESELTDFVFPVLGDDFISLNKKMQFTRLNNKLINANPFLRNAAKKLGLTHTMSFHTSRHTFATRCVRRGMQVTTLQKILCHSNVQTTMKYLHITGKDLEIGTQILNDKPQSSQNPVTINSFTEKIKDQIVLQTLSLIDGIAKDALLFDEAALALASVAHFENRNLGKPLVAKIYLVSELVGMKQSKSLQSVLNRKNEFKHLLKFEVQGIEMRSSVFHALKKLPVAS